MKKSILKHLERLLTAKQIFDDRLMWNNELKRFNANFVTSTSVFRKWISISVTLKISSIITILQTISSLQMMKLKWKNWTFCWNLLWWRFRVVWNQRNEEKTISRIKPIIKFQGPQEIMTILSNFLSAITVKSK